MIRWSPRAAAVLLDLLPREVPPAVRLAAYTRLTSWRPL